MSPTDIDDMRSVERPILLSPGGSKRDVVQMLASVAHGRHCFHRP
jgi:hypothetical protein